MTFLGRLQRRRRKVCHTNPGTGGPERCFPIAMVTVALLAASQLLLWADDPTSGFVFLSPISTALPAGASGNAVQLEIWNQASGGIRISTEGHTVDTDPNSNITNDTGFADLLLGRPGGLNPVNYPPGQSRYLDVTQGGASVLAARIPLYASVFTISPGPQGPPGQKGDPGPPGPVASVGAGDASITVGGTSSNPTVAIAANGITNSHIANGALSPAKITGTVATLGTNAFTAPQSITSTASSADALTINNNGNGSGINISSAGGTAVVANATGIGLTGVFGSGGFGGVGVLGFSNNNDGVHGQSTTGIGVKGTTGTTSSSAAGVYGLAGTASSVGTGAVAGVWGDSTTVDGVFGSSQSAAGVEGRNGGAGYGVVGLARNSSSYGVGVRGESFGANRFPNGNGSDGVDGFAHSTNGSGVAGLNDTDGPGVYGHSATGWGFTTDSNVNQARSMGGWIKAMAFVDPFAQGGIAVTRCFNSQQIGNLVSTPPCGITITSHTLGQNILDFGFQVNDRFVSLTDGGGSTTSVCGSPIVFCATSATQIFTQSFLPSGQLVDNPFFIFIF